MFVFQSGDCWTLTGLRRAEGNKWEGTQQKSLLAHNKALTSHWSGSL
jgi:hypothetical protein